MAADLTELNERLEYTQDRIDALAAKCREFVQKHVITQRANMKGSDQFAILAKVTAPVPTSIKSEAGMLANEIRSCLDELACRLATRNNRSQSETYFPISKSEEIFNDNGRRKIRKLSLDDQGKIISLRPWKGGNNMLWALHEADRTRKHQRLTAHSTGSSGFNIAGIQMMMGSGSFTNCTFNGVHVPELNSSAAPLLPGQPMGIATGRGHFPVRATFDICYEEPDVIAKMPVPLALSNFNAAARSIIRMF